MLGQNSWKYGLFVDLLFYYSESHVGLGDVEWPPDRQRVPIQATTRMVVRNDYWREWEREQGVVHQGSLDWSMEGWGMKLDRGKQKTKTACYHKPVVWMLFQLVGQAWSKRTWHFKVQGVVRKIQTLKSAWRMWRLKIKPRVIRSRFQQESPRRNGKKIIAHY